MTFEKVNHCLLEVRASDKLHAKIRKLISLKELPFVLKDSGQLPCWSLAKGLRRVSLQWKSRLTKAQLSNETGVFSDGFLAKKSHTWITIWSV